MAPGHAIPGHAVSQLTAAAPPNPQQVNLFSRNYIFTHSNFFFIAAATTSKSSNNDRNTKPISRIQFNECRHVEFQ
jgi:hypothetical protein